MYRIYKGAQEGYGKIQRSEQRRFFLIAFGSCRECQGVFALAEECVEPALIDKIDHLAASLYKLVKAT